MAALPNVDGGPWFFALFHHHHQKEKQQHLV